MGRIKESLKKFLWKTSIGYRTYHNQASSARLQYLMNSELLYAEIFNSSIRDSKWFKASVSPGRWAVGYNFMYVLYRILDEIQPKSILELGIGQTTKMLLDYKEYIGDINHIAVEQDAGWKDNLTGMTNNGLDFVRILPMIECNMGGYKVKRYEGFKDSIGQEQFDLILIDGPWGTDEGFSRIDILDICPDCLMDDFIIIVDDTNSESAIATVKLMLKAIEKKGIKYEVGTYHGQTQTKVIASWKYRFYATL